MTTQQEIAPLTIVQLVPALEGGGVEGCVLETAAGLVARGHKSVVISAGGRLVEELTSGGSEHFELDLGRKSPRALWAAVRLARLLRTLRADVVHARSRMPAWVAVISLKLLPQAARPRFLTTVHGLHSVNRYSEVMTFGQRVVAVSWSCRDYILHNYPRAPAGKVVVIPHGINHSFFSYGYRPPATWLGYWQSEFPELQGRFTILLPGRLTRLKGHFDLLRTLQQLLDRGVPAHALIVGGEDPRRQEYAQQVHQRIAELQLSDHVTFTGHRADLREIMCVSSAVVSTSTKPESFGRTVLEAVSLGRPTIGYDHGGVGEILAELYPEGRVPVGDVVGIADRLEAVYRGSFQPPPPSDAFSLDEAMRREIALYEEVANLTPT